MFLSFFFLRIDGEAITRVFGIQAASTKGCLKIQWSVGVVNAVEAFCAEEHIAVCQCQGDTTLGTGSTVEVTTDASTVSGTRNDIFSIFE